ncbi:hypothetical protein [Chroococcidiopsis sp. SAG 2025]|nr:hypothetical protein [Chroococcidiopsis sp. SAG 2025]
MYGLITVIRLPANRALEFLLLLTWDVAVPEQYGRSREFGRTWA